MTITLKDIQDKQRELAEMIASFEANASTTLIVFPETEITLQAGEHYAGIILGKDGEPNYHLILLPGEAESVTWKGAKDWAAKAGGDLPNRREQALLFANLKDQFQAAWYWSCEEYASDSDSAWGQDFHYGIQRTIHESSEFRARAVRRIYINA